MQIEIKIPSVGESVQEAILAQWIKQDGELVKKDEPLFVIETDKVTLDVNAEETGVLKIMVAEGETVAIGTVVGTIDTETAQGSIDKLSEDDLTKKVERIKEIKEKTETCPKCGRIMNLNQNKCLYCGTLGNDAGAFG
ncbi:biotin/lipoyl-containing protein [Desulfobacterales bacterium HSG17]|nr:biotin/lipoyl-containing protein [Desulfobacterales bacterium HSG17]